MNRSHWSGLLAVSAGAVLVTFYLSRLGNEANLDGAAIPPQGADDGSSAVVDEPINLDAPVDRAVRPTVTEPVDEGAIALDEDVLERVVMVLVLRGQLTVDASASPPIRWPEARFAVKPVSLHAAWIDLRLSAELQESGAFELRAECRRMPETALHDDEYVIMQIGYWTQVALTVSHPLLEQTTVEVPVAPWPQGLVAGPETKREIDVGTIGLKVASGVLGRVVAPDGGLIGDAVAGFCVLDVEDDLESSVPNFMLCDADGRFFLHHAPGAKGFVFATAPGMAPAWKRTEIVAETVTDLGVLELEVGYRLAGKVQVSESWNKSDHPLKVQVDGFDQSVHTSGDYGTFVLTPTNESFCWSSSDGVFRYLCRVEVGPEGSFEIGGLSQRCHRLRVQSPVVGWQQPLNDRIIFGRSDVWALKCAPATDIVLWPTTSVIHFRTVPTSRWPVMGVLTWGDELGNVQSMQVQLDGASVEAMPHQSIELQIEGDPNGRTHRIVAPAAGEVASYEFEVSWLPP